MQNDIPTVTLAQLVRTKPLNQWQRNYIGNKINRELYNSRGKSTPYQYAVGLPMIDTITGTKGIILERYRDNGHNKYRIDEKASGGIREKDIMRVA